MIEQLKAWLLMYWQTPNDLASMGITQTNPPREEIDIVGHSPRLPFSHLGL